MLISFVDLVFSSGFAESENLETIAIDDIPITQDSPPTLDFNELLPFLKLKEASEREQTIGRAGENEGGVAGEDNQSTLAEDRPRKRSRQEQDTSSSSESKVSVIDIEGTE